MKPLTNRRVLLTLIFVVLVYDGSWSFDTFSIYGVELREVSWSTKRHMIRRGIRRRKHHSPLCHRIDIGRTAIEWLSALVCGSAKEGITHHFLEMGLAEDSIVDFDGSWGYSGLCHSAYEKGWYFDW